MAKIASRPQRLGERHERDSPLEPPEGTHPAHTLISDFGLPQLRHNTFRLLLRHSVCDNLS